MSKSTDIVAYTFQAEQLCPPCVLVKMAGTYANREEALHANAENVLNFTAPFFGVEDRMNEDTFDSGDFPKVVFDSQVHPCYECAACEANLVAENPRWEECPMMKCDECGEVIE